MFIEGKALNKSFDSKSGEIVVMDHVDITIKQGEFVSLLGPTGCGKTTLLKMIAGLVSVDQGSLTINDKEVTEPGFDRAMVFQDAALFPWDDVRTNIAFGMEMRGIGKVERMKAADEWIKKVGLAGFEQALPHQLSGGMRQRAGLARALAVKPNILLMDEPFGAVDALTRKSLQEELLELWNNESLTVILVTHDINEAVLLSDRVLVMTKRPCKVKASVDIDIPRPRVFEEVEQSKEFSKLTMHLWQMLKEEIKA